MNKKINFLICPFAIMLMFLLLTNSCKKDDANPNLFNIGSFPLNVGNWWRYKVTDYDEHTTDTVLMKIVSMKVNGGFKTFTCYFDTNGMIVDSSYFKIYNNELIFNSYDTQDFSYFGTFDFVFPFISGDSSISKTNGFKTKIISSTNGYKLFGNSYDVYTVQTSYTGPNYHYDQNTIISKNIGIIQNSYFVINLGSSAFKLFELINYKINY